MMISGSTNSEIKSPKWLAPGWPQCLPEAHSGLPDAARVFSQTRAVIMLLLGGDFRDHEGARGDLVGIVLDLGENLGGQVRVVGGDANAAVLQ